MPLHDLRYDLDALARRDHAAHEARLHLPPEQPDRDDEHARRARRVVRARPGPCADGHRPGLLRVHRPGRLPRRDRAVRQGGPRRRRAADVLEDLRARRPARRLRRRAGALHRGDDEGAAAVRPDDAPRRSPRSRRSTAAPRSRGAARSTPTGSRGSPRSFASTASTRRRPSATSSTSRPAATRWSCSSACSTRA